LSPIIFGALVTAGPTILHLLFLYAQIAIEESTQAKTDLLTMTSS